MLSSFNARCQLCSYSIRKEDPKANLLCQQGIGGCRNQLFGHRKTHPCSVCISQEVTPLLLDHALVVVISYLLCAILHSLDVLRQLMKQLVVLSEFHIVCQPRTTLKVYFVIELTFSKQTRGLFKMNASTKIPQILNVDGLANAHESEARIILKTLNE